MCGRYTLLGFDEGLNKLLGLSQRVDAQPRYNIAPSQEIWISKRRGCVERAHWGWQPQWAKSLLINARAETAPEKATFRTAFAERRCVIPAHGFFEWKSKKEPFYFSSARNDPICFAGLFSVEGSHCQTLILTRSAEPPVKGIHERMPVILSLAQVEDWMSAAKLPGAESIELKTYRVSDEVNRPAFDRPDCIRPLEA